MLVAMAGREIRMVVSVLVQKWKKNGNMCVYMKIKRQKEQELKRK